MGIELINTNAGRVEPEPGVRMRAGQRGTFSGDKADLLLALDGVVRADSEEGRAYAEAHPEPVEQDPGTQALAASLNDLIVQAGNVAQQLTVALNNRVIGDDEAPLGPPQGTVTTRHQLADQNAVNAAAFAPNEGTPADVGVVNPQNAPMRHGSAVLTKQADEIAQAAIAAVHDSDAPDTPGSVSSSGRRTAVARGRVSSEPGALHSAVLAGVTGVGGGDDDGEFTGDDETGNAQHGGGTGGPGQAGQGGEGSAPGDGDGSGGGESPNAQYGDRAAEHDRIDGLRGDDLDKAVSDAGIDASSGGSLSDGSMSADEKRGALHRKVEADANG